LFFLHTLDEWQMRPKCLTCMSIYPEAGVQVTDSGSLQIIAHISLAEM
jgi:hypothetical protein